MLNLQNVTIQFNAHIIFKNINLVFKENTKYLWFGPSGAGKSTLAKAICGYEKIQSGSIVLSSDSPYSEMTYISQVDDLFFWQTLAESIQFLNNTSENKITAADIAAFQLTEVIHLYPYQLSGGMKKRFQLLRSLIFKSRVVILDECFSAIELSLRNSILTYIDRFWTQNKSIVICISHQDDQFLKDFFSNRIDFPLKS